MPIHRLNEEPTRHGILGDISCDSDGKVDQFIDRRDVKKTLPLHTFNRRSLYPGRISGGRLSGDPGRSAQSVRRHQRRARAAWMSNGEVVLETVIQGDTVREVLDYVQFMPARCSSSSAPTSKPRCAKAASATKNPAACCGSTKTA